MAETPEVETPEVAAPETVVPAVEAPRNPLHRAQWVLGALALLLIVALALLLIGRFPAASRGGVATPIVGLAPPSASVAAVQGAAFACAYTPEGACNTPASLGQLVFVGGQVRTGETGTVDVQTRTTVFRLGNSTQIHFRDVSDAVTQVVLEIGRLFASHDPGGRSVVRVQAGQVTIQAIDTRFSVETTTGGGVYVAVPADGGQVTILTGATTAASITLLAGQEILINPNINAPPAPRPLSPDEQARWLTVSCGWQAIAARLTPVALPPAPCATPIVPPTVPPTARSVRPTATPRPPSATPMPVLPTDTPGPLSTPPTPTPTVPPGRLITSYRATWLNTDRQTSGPPKLTLTSKAAILIVQWYKLCATHICAETTTNAPFSGEPFTVLSPEKHKIRLTLEKEGTVLMMEDGNTGARYSFRRVVLRDYTGTWINNDTTGATLPTLAIRSLSTKILVDWSSGCFNANCTSSGAFSSEPVATERYTLSLDNLAGTQLQVDDLVQSTTYYFHK